MSLSRAPPSQPTDPMMSDKNPNEVLITPQTNENDANHEMESLRHRVDALIDEKNSMEADFGYKRAKFKEIMLKKEGNLFEPTLRTPNPILLLWQSAK